MRGAKTYEEWGDAASRLDILEGRSKHAERRWKKETSLYDRELLEARLAHLRAVREQGKVKVEGAEEDAGEDDGEVPDEVGCGGGGRGGHG